MKRITLIQQSDTHASVDPHWELRWREMIPTNPELFTVRLTR